MPCQYLVEILLRIGPTMPGAMGPVPLTEQEILAWQVNRRHFLQPWEVDFVRRLSAMYAGQLIVSQDAHCREPLAPMNPTRVQAAAITTDMRAALRGMAS